MQNLHILHNNIASSSTRFMCRCYFCFCFCSSLPFLYLSLTHTYTLTLYFYLLLFCVYVYIHVTSRSSYLIFFVLFVRHSDDERITSWATLIERKIFTQWSSLIWMSYFLYGIFCMNTFCNKQIFCCAHPSSLIHTFFHFHYIFLLLLTPSTV